MSFFRVKNKGSKSNSLGEFKIDSENIAIQSTPPTDSTKLFWVDTSKDKK